MRKRTTRALLGAILASLLGASAQSKDSPPPRRDRLAGLLAESPEIHNLEKYGYPKAKFWSYKNSDLASATFGVELCVLEIPSGSGRMRVKDIRADKSPTEIFEKEFPPDALGVVNGGFFGLDKAGKPIPIGLVKSDGKAVSSKYPWKSGGVVAISGDQVSVLPIAKLTDPQRYSGVIQSKPLLVEEGADGIRTAMNDRFDRSAVAIDAKGTVYFAVIHEPSGSAASLAEFSFLLRGLPSAEHDPIQWALAMDGGPGAHLYIPVLKRHCGAGMPNFVPNALYVTK